MNVMNLGNDRTKLHIMMDVVLACMNKPLDYYLKLESQDIDDTQEYDNSGKGTTVSDEEVYQSRVSILDSDTDAEGRKQFQVDISIYDLFEASKTIEVNAGFMIHEIDGIDEARIYVKPNR